MSGDAGAAPAVLVKLRLSTLPPRSEKGAREVGAAGEDANSDCRLDDPGEVLADGASASASLSSLTWLMKGACKKSGAESSSVLISRLGAGGSLSPTRLIPRAYRELRERRRNGCALLFDLPVS